jgi:putative Holliday junction resolvase
MEEWFMMAAEGSIRALGLDFGAKTVGVSASDALGVTAQGLEIIRRKSENKLRQTLARIDELARERRVEVIVLGLPRTMGGKLSERTYRTLKFGEMVQKRQIFLLYIGTSG